MTMILYFEKEKADYQIKNKLGVFYYLKKYQMFTAVIKGDKFGYNFSIRVSFPCVPNSKNISEYQMDYYQKIQENWRKIEQEFEKKLNYATVGQSLDTIIIPDIRVKEKFDFDANIIFEIFKNDFIDVHIIDMKIVKLLKNGKELKTS